MIWTPGSASSTGGTTYMSKYYFDHISETINLKARDLIFGTGTPFDIENRMLQCGHQAAPHLQVAPPIYQKFILTISQRLLKLET